MDADEAGSSARVTRLLRQWQEGDRDALDRLIPLVYDELKVIASRHMAHEWRKGTLQTTGLVNEAYIRLIGERGQNWQNRTHFLAIAALSMRQILVQRARRRKAAKRGGDPERITLNEQLVPATGGGPGDVDVLALDAALDRLAALDERQAKVVEMRYFGGLTVEETADALGISPATVKRHWTVARAWLRRELAQE